MTKLDNDATAVDDRPTLLEVNKCERSLAPNGGKCRFINAPEFSHRADSLYREMAALEQRWKNRLTAKDFNALGESYFNGRLSIALYFEVIVGVANKRNPEPSAIQCDVKPDIYVAILICDMDSAKAGNLNVRDEEVVFVNVVGLPDFPNCACPSLIRLYRIQDEHCKAGNGFHYSTIRWSFGSRSGRAIGVPKRLPCFVGREHYSLRGRAMGLHNPCHDIIERATHTVKGITNGEAEIEREWLGTDAKRLRSSIQVMLYRDRAEITFDMGIEDRYRLLDVMVGPIDL